MLLVNAQDEPQKIKAGKDRNNAYKGHYGGLDERQELVAREVLNDGIHKIDRDDDIECQPGNETLNLGSHQLS